MSEVFPTLNEIHNIVKTYAEEVNQPATNPLSPRMITCGGVHVSFVFGQRVYRPKRTLSKTRPILHEIQARKRGSCERIRVSTVGQSMERTVQRRVVAARQQQQFQNARLLYPIRQLLSTINKGIGLKSVVLALTLAKCSRTWQSPHGKKPFAFG